MDFSPDGRTLAVGTLTGRLFVFRRTEHGWVQHAELPAQNGVIVVVRFSADGTVLYTADSKPDGGIVRWNTTLWRPIGGPLPLPGIVLTAAATADGVLTMTTHGRLVHLPARGRQQRN